MPQKRGRNDAGHASASALIDRPEVLLAKIACRADVRRHLFVQRLLPVHALGDRLDHQVAAREQCQVLIVVGRIDVVGAILGRQRRWLELSQIFDRLLRNAVRIAFLGRKVEQQRQERSALARCAAICAPMTPAPSTATLRTRKWDSDMAACLDDALGVGYLQSTKTTRRRTSLRRGPDTAGTRSLLGVYVSCSPTMLTLVLYEPLMRPICGCACRRSG